MKSKKNGSISVQCLNFDSRSHISNPDNKISILYTDDSCEMLLLTRLVLEETGLFRVETVTSPDEAFRQIIMVPYDCIVSDFHILCLDRISLVKKIRDHGINTPFVLVSESFSDVINIHDLDEGTALFFSKFRNIKFFYEKLEKLILDSVRPQNGLLKSTNKKFPGIPYR